MTKISFKLAGSILTITLMASVPAYAKTINSDEGATYYDKTRGWNVYSVGDGRGFNSCRAVRGRGYMDQIMIDYAGHNEYSKWSIFVQARRTPRDDGAGGRGAYAYYDNQRIDRQIGFGVPGHDGSSTTHASLDIEDYELGLFKSGSTFGLDISGERNRSWSLRGSSAAMTKIVECYNNQGVKPKPRRQQRTVAPRSTSQKLPFFTNSMGDCTGYGNWAVKTIRQAQSRGCDVRRTGENLNTDFHTMWCYSQTSQTMAAAPRIHSNGVRKRCQAMGYSN